MGDALLYAPLEDLDPEDDSTVVAQLRNDAIDRNQVLKPLTSTQLCHYPIDSLDRPTGIVNGMPVCVGDALTISDGVDELLTRLCTWADERIPRVLARLTAQEKRVALLYAAREVPTSWAEAAVQLGLPAEFGERVRRKLRREGALLQNRLAQTPIFYPQAA